MHDVHYDTSSHKNGITALKYDISELVTQSFDEFHELFSLFYIFIFSGVASKICD